MIQIVSLLEYPTVALYDGVLLASYGSRFDWPEATVRRHQVQSPYAEFLDEHLRPETEGSYCVEDPAGGWCWVRRGPGGAVAVAAIPAWVFDTKLLERRRIRRTLERGSLLTDMLAYAGVPDMMLRVMVHGMVSLNSQIIGSCAAVRTGAMEHLVNIEKSGHLLRSLATATLILSPAWKPDLTKNPLNSLHGSVMLQAKIWKKDLATRNIEVQIGACHAQVHMDSFTLTAILLNIFYNATKYMKSRTRLKVRFEEEGNGARMLVHFRMCSTNIFDDELDRITWIGGRGRAVRKKPGDGLGLAVVARALHGYGGELRIFAEKPDSQGPGYAKNTFTLVFNDPRM